MDVGTLIRSVREQSGLSQKAMAQRAGTTQSALSAYERGRRPPTFATVERLLEVAGARLEMQAVPISERPSAVLDRHRQEVLDRAKSRGVTRVLVFGSVARGDDTAGSDVDLLMDFPAGSSLLDVIGLQQELSELLGITVDLGTLESLRPTVRNEVLVEARPL